MSVGLDLFRGRVAVVWAILVALTLLSWWMGTDHGFDDTRLASISVLVVAFVKVRYVGLYFMELRGAPAALRLAYEGWCLVVCAALLGMYLIAV